MFSKKDYEFGPVAEGFPAPLVADEVIICLKDRLGASYDLQLVVRNGELYLQIMWAFLEQQSFPLDQDAYYGRINDVTEVLNRLGLACFVREWLENVTMKPRVGRPVTLLLKGGDSFKEFVL